MTARRVSFLYPTGDTIVAQATALGRAAVAMVRLSGPEVETLLREAVVPWRGESARRVWLAEYRAGAEGVLDQVVAVCFKAPGSYTGEDVAELTCHGSPFIVDRLIRDCIARGARLAEPGEFTFRAFLNGKMDLCQAEAVRELVESQTLGQVIGAQRALCGSLKGRLEGVRKRIVDVLVELETRIEFATEDLPVVDAWELSVALEQGERELGGWIESYERGRLIREGVRVVLAGRPNVGKSSLFNRLLEEDRAIVTSVPGTTRDCLREWVDLGGVRVCLIDTAGIRSTWEDVERLGVEKAEREIEEADLIVFMLDASLPAGSEDERGWRLIENRPHVVVVNKIDRGWEERQPSWARKVREGAVKVSARTGEGIEELTETVSRLVVPGGLREAETPVVTSLRQRVCVERALDAVRTGRIGLRDGVSEEYVAEVLRGALSALGELVGETTSDEILRDIFSRFCIGK